MHKWAIKLCYSHMPSLEREPYISYVLKVKVLYKTHYKCIRKCLTLVPASVVQLGSYDKLPTALVIPF